MEHIDPQSSRTTGYHLFLEPAGDLSVMLREQICGLADTFGSPTFNPQVTLPARVPGASHDVIFEQSQLFARTCTPITLTLGKLVMEDSFYSALYRRVEEQESMRLMHAAASRHFRVEEDAGFTAHLSLLYGNHMRAQKELVLPSIGLPQDPTFVADTLHVYRTEGEVGQWHMIGAFPMLSTCD